MCAEFSSLGLVEFHILRGVLAGHGPQQPAQHLVELDQNCRVQHPMELQGAVPNSMGRCMPQCILHNGCGLVICNFFVVGFSETGKGLKEKQNNNNNRGATTTTKNVWTRLETFGHISTLVEPLRLLVGSPSKLRLQITALLMVASFFFDDFLVLQLTFWKEK